LALAAPGRLSELTACVAVFIGAGEESLDVDVPEVGPARRVVVTPAVGAAPASPGRTGRGTRGI